MKRYTFFLYTSLFFCCTIFASLAQTPQVSRQTNVGELRQLATQWDQQYRANRQRAVALAPQKGWVIDRSYPNGTVVSLQGVDETGMPIYHITTSNVRSAATTRTDQLWPTGATGFNLTGASPYLAGRLGIWDGGRPRLTHQELRGRIALRDNAARNETHPTHVAGTLIASGINTLARGMAYEAPDLQAWDFNNDTPEMATGAAEGLLVSNHSYGSISGWNYNPDRAGTATDPFWEWHGNVSVSTTEDVKFGYYNTQAREWDRIVYNAPYYLPVKSAGNNRTVTGPEVGEPYWQFNANGNRELVASRPNNISLNNTFNTIPTYGNGKNILTVGASDPIAQGYNQVSDVRITLFSSFGPTDDGRIKPDLVGNGLNVLSSSAVSDESYAVLGGTSMSAPNVSGSLLLLQELYYRQNNNTFMRAATLKGLAIHTADEAGIAPGPDYIFGWGLLNAERAAQTIANTNNTNLISERTLAQGQTYSLQVVASGAGPLEVTISWTDPEAEVISMARALNNRSPRLVNDLDMRVRRGTSTTYQPWILNPTSPTDSATRGDNVLDNVEKIFIPDAVPGEAYTITVSHKGTLQRGPQAFSLLVSGIGGETYCPSAATSNADSKITQFSFGTTSPITYTAPAGCTTYTNLNSLSTGVELGQTVPLSLTVGTCGANQNKVAKVFIDWNGDGNFTTPGDLVATSGVIAGTGTFSTDVTVPSTVEVGYITRMRVVLMETTNPESVLPCGTYPKGETQDYTVFFTRPSVDVGPNGILLPQTDLCANENQRLTVSLRNYGTTPVTDIPVTTTIRDPQGVVATLTGTFAGVIPAFGQAEFTYNQTFPTRSSSTYTFTIRTNLAGEADPSNDVYAIEVRVNDPAPSPEVSARICGAAATVLQGYGEGTLFWYDAPSGGNLLATGSPAFTTARTPGNIYYAALNDFAGSFGPETKDVFGGGGYNQFSPAVRVQAQVPLVIQSARLYIGHSGRIIFTLESLDGTPLSTAVLDVEATRTTPAEGEQPDDPNDPGQVYDLNLVIPQAGEYRITVEYENGATIYRNNLGVTGYPYSIPGVISIVGNTATATPDQYYYYFYDLQVKATGCPSERVAVVASVSEVVEAEITPQGPTFFCMPGAVLLQANTGTNLRYQWYRNGLPIPGATTDTLRASVSGNFQVVVSNLTGCSSTSAVAGVTANPIPATPTILQTDRILQSSATTGTHQWFRDGTPIPGANQATYSPDQNGAYTVVVTVNGCSSPSSEPFRFTLTDYAAAGDVITNIWIYPNPSSDGHFITRFNVKNSGTFRLRVLNAAGQLVYREGIANFAGDYEAVIDLRGEAAGIYFLRIEYRDRVIIRKLLIRR